MIFISDNWWLLKSDEIKPINYNYNSLLNKKKKLDEERNKLSPENDSREDIRKLLLKIMNSPEKKKHNKLFGAR